MKPRIVLVGVAGFAGSHLLRGFLAAGFPVVGVKRSTSNTERINDLLGSIAAVDSDTTTWADILQAGDIVINVATDYGRNSTEAEIDKTNITMPLAIATAGKQAGIKSYWNIDTFWNRDTELAKQINYYAYTKHVVKEELKSLGLPQLVNLRFFHMFGPQDNPAKFFPSTIKKLAANEPIDMTTGEQLYDIISVREVVSMLVFIAEHIDTFNHPFEDFDIGMGQQFTIKYLVEQMKTWAGSTSELRLGVVPFRDNEIMNALANPQRLVEAGYTFVTNPLAELEALVKLG